MLVITNTTHVEISLCWQETLYQCECKFILVIRYCTEGSANFLHFAQHVCFHVNFHPHKQLFFGPRSHMSTWVPKVLDLICLHFHWYGYTYAYIYIHTNYFRDRHSSQDFNKKKKGDHKRFHLMLLAGSAGKWRKWRPAMYISQAVYQSPIPLHRTPDWKPLVLVFEVVAVLLIFSTVEFSRKNCLRRDSW